MKIKMAALLFCITLLLSACSQQNYQSNSESQTEQEPTISAVESSEFLPESRTEIPDNRKIGLTVSQFTETLGDNERGYEYLSNIEPEIKNEEMEGLGVLKSYTYEFGKGVVICFLADPADDMVVDIWFAVTPSTASKDEMDKYYFYAANTLHITEGSGAGDIMDELKVENETKEANTSAYGRYCRYSYMVSNNKGEPFLYLSISPRD